VPGLPQEIHFDFHHIGRRWLLDDVHSVKEPRWSLSQILQCSSKSAFRRD
jgi:hypothetical protein